jgi:hypothetical protein
MHPLMERLLKNVTRSLWQIREQAPRYAAIAVVVRQRHTTYDKDDVSGCHAGMYGQTDENVVLS